MAQRLIHQLFAEKIISAVPDSIISAERFTFGSLLPDAYVEEDMNGARRRGAARRTHFRKATPDNLFRYFDFAEYYGLYEERIRTDDMYLGYMIHLVEDAFYRDYIHNHKSIPRAATNELLEKLHSDYRKLNSYIMKKYGLREDVVIPGDFENEQINEVYPFDTGLMLGQLREDYSDSSEGRPFYIDSGLLDRFMRLYLPRCADAVRAFRSGFGPEAFPDPLSLKWSAGEHKEVL